jgi:excisionase family DNA binding protein
MTVYRMFHSGELKGIRFGRNFRITAGVLRAFINGAAVNE